MEELQNLTPLYNKEFYLAYLCGEDVELPIPDGNTEHYLAYLCGMDVTIPDVPDGRTETYLAYKCGEDVVLPDPMYRIEYYLAKWCGIDCEVPEPMYRIEYWLAQLANSGELKTVTGNPISVSDALARPAESLTIEILPQQSGSGDPSPDNVRPISGHDSVKVWDDPKHGGTIEWNQLIENGNFATTTGIDNYGGNISVSDNILSFTVTDIDGSPNTQIRMPSIDMSIGHKYLISLLYKPSHSKTRAWCFCLKKSGSGDNISCGTATMTGGIWNQLSAIVSPTDDNSTYGTLQIVFNAHLDGYSIGDVDYLKNLQVFDLTQMFGAGNEPTTVDEFRALFPHDYYPYDAGTQKTVSEVNGDPYWKVSVVFPDSVGTVYGGTLDVTSGVLTVDSVIDTFTKDSNWYGFATGTGNSSAVVQLSNYLNVKYVDGASSSNGAISSTGREAQNYWVTARQNETPNEGDMSFAYSQTGQLRFHRLDVANITDLASFKANFPDTTICYYLATPLTYQLTPTEVQMLLGDNTLWNDVGDMTLEYLADGPADDADALMILLGNRYVNNGEPDEATDREALDILLGGNIR